MTLRVLELTAGEEAAAWCGKLFVRAGAEVVRGEPAGHVAERAADLYLNLGKRRIELTPQDERLRLIARDFDVVVTDVPARVVDSASLRDLEAPVVVSITPFGLSGPYRHWEATAATLLALSGHTHVMGDPGRAPLTLPGNYPYYQAGNFAFVGALAAVLAPSTARIEVSVLECLATLHQFTDTMWTAAGRVRSRHGNRWENLHPVNMLPCADGWFSLNVLDNFWFRFAHMIGRPEAAENHPWASNLTRLREAEDVDRAVLDALGGWTKERIFLEAQDTWRVPVGHLQSLGELLDDPHLRDRGFWQRVDGVDVPSSPYRIDGAIARERAPHSGAPSARARPVTRPASTRPLDGIRVLELCHFWSGPLCGRLLGDLGADVVKVEARDARGGYPGWAARQDDPEAVPPGRRPWNLQPLTTKLNRNKRSVSLDLKSPAGRDVFLKLVDRADVLIENFSARALPSLGLGHDVLRARNPRLVSVAMPGFGLTGRYREYVALGPSTEPMTGLTALMGYSPDEPRVTSKAILDPMSGTLTAVAVLDALYRRSVTGEGALVEVSQHECGIAYVGEQIIERQLSGAEPVRAGNAHRTFSPHGVYRCAGSDEWIAIAVRTDEEWLALCAVAGLRPEERDDADASLEAFTATRDKLELCAALQDAGVPAGAVLSAPEWLSDAHLESRGYFCELADADSEPRRVDGLPILVEGCRDYSTFRRAPMLGEHNAEVLIELASLTSEDVQSLVASRVLSDRPS